MHPKGRSTLILASFKVKHQFPAWYGERVEIISEMIPTSAAPQPKQPSDSLSWTPASKCGLMRLIIFHLYTDLIIRLRPPAMEARCRERRSAQQTTTNIWCVRHTCRQPPLASHAALPLLHQRMHERIRALYPPTVKHVWSLSIDPRLSDETAWGLGAGWRHESKHQKMVFRADV